MNNNTDLNRFQREQAAARDDFDRGRAEASERQLLATFQRIGSWRAWALLHDQPEVLALCDDLIDGLGGDPA